MGFRLSRRIRIAPGIRVNLGKSGLSLSGGMRGARVTIGGRGARGTVGAPGTGMSYSATSGNGSGGSGQGGGIGCGTILIGLLVLGVIVQQCSPSSGSWIPSGDATTDPTFTTSPTPDVSAPIALSVAALPAVHRNGAITLAISAAPGVSCEVGVPLAARTGDAPTAVVVPQSGTATVLWKAGKKASSSVITVVCTLGDQREAIELTEVVK